MNTCHSSSVCPDIHSLKAVVPLSGSLTPYCLISSFQITCFVQFAGHANSFQIALSGSHGQVSVSLHLSFVYVHQEWSPAIMESLFFEVGRWIPDGHRKCKNFTSLRSAQSGQTELSLHELLIVISSMRLSTSDVFNPTTKKPHTAHLRSECPSVHFTSLHGCESGEVAEGSRVSPSRETHFEIRRVSSRRKIALQSEVVFARPKTPSAIGRTALSIARRPGRGDS
jgi:hypothetical protein